MSGSVSSNRSNTSSLTSEPVNGAQVTPTRAAVIDPRQFYSDWSGKLKTKVNSVLYRYQIFISNPEELEYDSDVYHAVKSKVAKDIDDTLVLGWWNVEGSRTYKATLNQKRQTLCNTLKLSVKRKFPPIHVW